MNKNRFQSRGYLLSPISYLLSTICVVGSCCAAAPAAAQQDPTRPSAAMAGAMRGRIADISDLAIRALVVGGDDNGVALLGARDFTGLPVRRDSIVNQEVDGVNVPLEVESVTSAGVKIRTSAAEDGEWTLPGSFKALPPPEGDAAGLLRYVEFTRVPLATALRLIADQSGANISASASTEEKEVSIFLRNVKAETAVEEICRATGLWFRHDAATGIIRVTSMQEYEESLSSFREEQTESYTLLYPNVFEVASVIYGLYPERVMLSLGEEDILDSDQDDISRRFERFNQIASSGSSSFMKMDPGSVSVSGGGGGSGTIAFNNGRVTVVPPMARLAVDDARKLNDAESKGAESLDKAATDYQTRSANIFVTVSRKNSMLMVRTSDAKAMEDIRALVKRLDVPTPMVLLEVKVLELLVDDDFASTFEYEITKDYRTTSSDSKMEAKAGFQGLNPLATEGRTDSLSFRLLSHHINMRIQLMEQEGKAKTLATPMLLTANNEVSRLFIGEERPMVRNITSQTIANGDTTITVPQTEIQFQDVGTLLLITPNINADRTVTLRLLQENSEINEGGASIPIYSATDGGIIQNVSVDVVSSRSVSGTFVAKDEMTMAVGGLVTEVESEQERRVPFLGRIPLLGWFFKSKERVKQRTELIVMIRPHVISTPADGEDISKRVLEGLSEHPARDGRKSLDVLKEGDKPLDNATSIK